MSGGDFLDAMAATSRERAAAAASAEPETLLAARAAVVPPPPRLALGSFDLIAELKLESPAAGSLAEPGFDRGAQVSAYARAGAAAISVLTEPSRFGGDLAHLEEAASQVARLDCPVMRKDFLTSTYQVLEARAAGAGGVLVIVTMLDDGAVMELVNCARAHGMFVLLEGFAVADLDRISALPLERSGPPVLAGVNCRDLRTLEVDFARFDALAHHLPRGLPAVAESGIASAEHARRVAALGYRLALVGSSLMAAPDPAAELGTYLEAGRSARQAATEAS